MSDRDALLAAILADPDDDLPRLVFADWLEETGHPAHAARAHYIRAQIELAQQPPGSDAWYELNRRSHDLFDRFRDEWKETFSNPNDWHGFTITRRRGFVDEVKTTLERLVEVGGLMFASAPIRVLRVPSGREETWPKFRELKFLGGLRVLQFGPGLWQLARWPVLTEHDPFDFLFAHRSLTGLRRLELSGNGLNDRFVVRLTARFPDAPFAPALRELDLSKNEVTDAGANALATGRGLDRLELLNLGGNRVTAIGAAPLRARFADRVSL